MKKSILLLSIIAFCFNSFAQSQFTEATLNEINARYIKNPVEFLKTETAPNFLYTGTDGKAYNLAETIQIYSVLQDISREYSNVKVLQNGLNAVVSAKMKHITSIKQTQQKMVFDEVITMTVINQNDKWLLQSVNHNNAITDLKAEEAAIRKVIKDETDGYYEANFDKVAAQWSDKASNEYQNQQLKFLVGKPYAKGEEQKKLTEMAKKVTQKQDVTVEESDYEVRQNGNMAWVTYNQKVATKDGKLNQNTRQTRILEKINGEWKIAFVAGVDLK